MNIILTLCLTNECPDFIMHGEHSQLPWPELPYNEEPQITITFQVLRETRRWVNDMRRKTSVHKYFKKCINVLDKSTIQDYTQDFPTIWII